MQGLLALRRQHPILAVTDMSATPVYFTENAEDPAPFQWVVSDYSIVDAMEAGLVKIPKAPYGTGSRFRDIYQQCVEEEARKKRRCASITFRWTERDANCQALRDALDLLYAHYEKLYAHWQSIYQEPEGVNNLPDNPAMAIIMNTVASANSMYRYVTDSGKGKELFQNRIDPDSGEIVGLPRTIVIHSKISEETEKDDQSDNALKLATRQIAAAYRRHYSFPPDATDNEALRQALSSVGKPGQPGEHVRCVVSVNMLTEGWDARNVTHILGFRAFKSSLLCEQAAGRALRRVAYDFDDAGRLHPEYAYILGIPFPEITGGGEQTEPPPRTRLPQVKVTPVADRQSIEFPNISRLQRDDNAPLFTVRLKDRIQGEQTVPAAPELAADVASHTGPETRLSADVGITQGNFLYKTAATALYRVIQEAQSAGDRADIPAHQTFAQLHTAAAQCAAQGHIRGPANRRQWSNRTADINRVAEWLHGQMEVVNPEADGEQRVAMRAIPSRNRPWLTTRDFRERTVPAKHIYPDSGRRHTHKSPISHAVGDSGWEAHVAAALDNCPLVDRWVRNYGLNWSIPYLADGNRHEYRPDFVAVCPLDSGEELHWSSRSRGWNGNMTRLKPVGPVTGAKRSASTKITGRARSGSISTLTKTPFPTPLTRRLLKPSPPSIKATKYKEVPPDAPRQETCRQPRSQAHLELRLPSRSSQPAHGRQRRYTYPAEPGRAGADEQKFSPPPPSPENPCGNAQLPLLDVAGKDASCPRAPLWPPVCPR